MADWSAFLFDLLVEFAKKLTYYEDFINFSRVCTSWQSAAATINPALPSRFPYLILPDGYDDDDDDGSVRRFYLLSGGGTTLKSILPEASKKRCLSARGWLLTVAEDEIEAKLVHPITRRQFDLPRLDTLPDHEYNSNDNMHFVSKVILSSDPLFTSDFLVIIIWGGNTDIGFCKPGDVKWTSVDHWPRMIYDIVYHKGKVYGVDTYGEITVCDIRGSNPTTLIPISKIPSGLIRRVELLYILEWYDDDKFLIVSREGFSPHVFPESENPTEWEDLDYKTEVFQAFEFDLSHNKWLKVEDLGNRTVFLGYNSSFWIDSSSDGCIKPNCIYFTDDICDYYLNTFKGGGKDMGIYNLSDGTTETFFKPELRSLVTPPTWVESSI